MLRTYRSRIHAFAVIALVAATDNTLTFTSAAADRASLPFLSPMFGDNMVLQRGKANPIWGWAKPGQLIRVEIAGHTATAVTGSDGRWQAQIQPPAGGGPYTVEITGPQSIELHGVLVGDVWLCGGQSNMYLGLSQVRDGAEEVKAADHPEIRLYLVQQHPSYSPTAVPQGTWKICSPQTVAQGGAGGFSAVAYFFGSKLNANLHVPIGLIEDCVGGTPAQTWMSPETLHELMEFEAPLAEIERLRLQGGPEYGNYIMHWYDQYDVGLKGNTWAAPDFNDSSWKTVQLPGGFQELGVGDVPGVCWFRKEITLPSPLPAGKAALFLGPVEKMGTTYINGHWVGASSWVENPRVYQVGDGILTPGRNVLAIRVFKVKPRGGFLAKPEVLRLVLGDKSVVPLAGEWKGALSVDARPPHPMPLGLENYPTMPSVLYEGMIKPVAPLALTGAIWYQGEANADRAYQYRTLLPAMIGDWRRLFAQGDFPFYIVSLPAFMHRRDQPGDAPWAELREAQALTAGTVRNAGLAVTIDTGDPDDIHPKDKKVVGERLALCALAQQSGKNIPFAGPTFASVEHLPGALKLRFEHADGGLVVKGNKLEEFSVAGKHRKWYWADARVEGDSVVVSSQKVPEPVAARYAWQANPAATLYNGAGLPAVPFRTDNWPGITEPASTSGSNSLAPPAAPTTRQDHQTLTDPRWAGGTPALLSLTAEQDHQRLMDLLHIAVIRRGRDGNNPQSPYHANYDEARANPFPNLPDPLVMKDGRKVTTAEMWWKERRPEIVEDFDREVYGRVPKDTPKVNWEETSARVETNGNVPVITKQLVGHVDNSSYPPIGVNIQLTLTTPAKAAGPVPVIMQFGFAGFGGGPGGRGGAGIGEFGRTNSANGTNGFARRPSDGTNGFGISGFGGGVGGGGPNWQQQVLAKGWGWAVLSPKSVQADNGAGLTQGIIGLMNKGRPRKVDDWGALRGWAWGASRALDHFETDKAVDARRVGIEGHSRFGKATLVAMAYDPRFAIAYVSSSGEGGAKLHRRDWGEIVENVAGTGEYHWMAGNFIKYAGPLNWDDLPVDSHELIALCAPRPVFLSAGATNGDAWVDAKGTFLAGVGAGPVYRLLGKKDMGATEFPPIETPLIAGEVAFRQHRGGHTDRPNWPTFLKFAEKYFAGSPSAMKELNELKR